MIDVQPAQIEAFDPAMLGAPKHERIPNDLYETPEWCTHALLRHVRLSPFVWEPAAGKGKISRVLEAHGYHVHESDLVSRSTGIAEADFLETEPNTFAWEDIVTNPPYSIANEFLAKALESLTHRNTVAMLMRNEWDCAQERAELVHLHPHFALKIVLTRRPRWIEGTTGSPRHNYAWYVWQRSHTRTANGPPRVVYAQ